MRSTRWATVLALGVISVSADDSVTTETRVETSRTERTALDQAQRWGLSTDDWTRYQEIMQGPRGIWSPNLDPITALGVAADSDSERKRYAEILVRVERDRVQHELAFERAVQEAKHDLFPDDPLIDRKALQTLVAANKDGPLTQSGDRLLLFVSLDCSACGALTQQLVSDVQSTPGLQLDIYVTGLVRDDAIQAWASKLKLPPGLVQQNRLTLNHDHQTLSRLIQDPLVTVPVLIRKRGEQFTVLPNDPVGLSQASTR